MKKFKKYAALLTALCLTIGSAAFAVSCKDSDNSSTDSQTSESSESSDSSDSSGETAEKFILTITVQKEDGTGVEGIKFRLKRRSTRLEASTDANGVVTFEAVAGSYELNYVDGNPAYHSGDWVTLTHEVELTQNQELTFVLIDESPNGSAERPFNFVINADGTTETMVIPANTTYYYTLYRTTADNLILENANLTASKEGTAYSPVDGVIVMPIGLDGTHDHTIFTLTNTSNEEITVTGYTTSNAVQGTLRNPFTLTIDTAITARPLDSETDNGTVYYKWQATGSGTLTITSEASGERIVLENNSTSVVSNEWSLNVNEGDVLYVIVHLVLSGEGGSDDSGTALDSLTFTAHFE